MAMPDDVGQQLRLIYSQLEDAENDPEKRLELLERSREELGQMINKIDREAKPGLFAFMAENGAKGGAAKSTAKAAAARANGAKGGRPKNLFTLKRFPEDSIKVLMLAQEEARQLGHNRCGTEQLLLGLIGEGNGRAAQVLTAMGLTLTEARATVKQLEYGHDLDADSNAPQGGAVATWVRSLRESWKETPFSELAKRALEFSWKEAWHTGKNFIETEDLLLGILDVPECRGCEVIRAHGIDVIKLRQSLTAKQ